MRLLIAALRAEGQLMVWSFYRYRPSKAHDVHAIVSFLKPPLHLLSCFLSYRRGKGNTEIHVSNTTCLSKAGSLAPDPCFCDCIISFLHCQRAQCIQPYREGPEAWAFLQRLEMVQDLWPVRSAESQCVPARLGPRQRKKRHGTGSGKHSGSVGD